ncbi:MAG TPA: SLC13 family permease, partial [Burkholderiales bacterium]
ALACAANVGSAATLIGNPQNMLIGETLKLSFGGYISQALFPVLLGLAVTWGLIAWQTRGRWMQAMSVAAEDAASERREDAPFDRWQTAKGLSVSAALLAVFLFVPSWPRDVAALTGAGLLLMSRRLHSNKMLGLVDWELLILFIGLFVVNHALQETGIAAGIVADLAAAGVNLERPGPLFAATLVLSNVVSNVPAVMLLLPVAEHALAGPTLALVSTLSGNLLIVGSIANIIVVNAAARRGIRMDWRRHARTGVPVTFATLAICAASLWWRMPSAV